MGPVCLDALSPGRLRVAILRVVERAYLVAEVAESAPFPLSPVVALFHVSCLAQVMFDRRPLYCWPVRALATMAERFLSVESTRLEIC